LLCTAITSVGLLGFSGLAQPQAPVSPSILLAAGSDIGSLAQEAKLVDFAALRRAIEDLQKSHPGAYPADTYLAKLDAYEKELPGLVKVIDNAPEPAGAWLSRQAVLETCPLMPEHSAHTNRLLAGDCPAEWAFHSQDPADKPWIIIDLGKVQKIGGLQMVNRPGFFDRAAKLVVSISTDKQGWQELWRNQGGGKAVWSLEFAQAPEARYLKLWLDDRNTFHLKTVKVFGPVTPLDPAIGSNRDAAAAKIRELLAWRREALLANPLLKNFDQIMVVRRNAGKLGMPTNWQGNSSMASRGYDNELMLLDFKKADTPLKTFFKPADNSSFVGDIDLNFDADKLLFSMPGTNNRWHIWEIKADGSGLRQVTDPAVLDYDSYDACYLPDGRIILCSTMGYQGVPCVGGADHVGNLCIMNADGTSLRRLTYDQDHNWSPTVKNDGMVMFQRWEYTDSAHYFSRIIFDMYPDGREQRAMYGSNSYWPNSLFYARPIPGADTKFVGIVTGHHGVARVGEMVLFDTARGRQEATGAVQRLPGWGKKVESIVLDGLVNNSWPKFLHPWPLSDKYFLVAAQPTPASNWGLYLIDVFDNMLLLKEVPGNALLEPIPFVKTVKPPVIPDQIKLDSKEATVYITDIYTGPGLRGVPKGTVKNLLVYAYEYGFRGTGNHDAVAFEGPWDIRKIIGTVPVYADGSASFKIPSNVPVALLPLDENGDAVQMFRSWFVGVPGEVVSCVGCHENRDTPPPARDTIAYKKEPAIPVNWRGPFRGFSFDREVQPVLDKYCVGCHNGTTKTMLHAGAVNMPDFRGRQPGWHNFSQAYLELMPYIRRNGPEGDWTGPLNPLEFHADVQQLFQMLRKGHHNVRMDAEAWDRLQMWVNMDVPCYGRWNEYKRLDPKMIDRIRELRKKYAGVEVTSEDLPVIEPQKIDFQAPPAKAAAVPAVPEVKDWPLTAEAAKALQQKLGKIEDSLDLGNDVAIKIARIPAGSFVMGNAASQFDDEKTLFKETVKKPFWMGTTEITLRQFRQFRQEFKNGYYDRHHKDQVNPGYDMDTDVNFPAIRISQTEAADFCQWLSKKSGRKVRLPTEAEWEWACRAGSASELNYGDRNTDFGAVANLADLMMQNLAVNGVNPTPMWGIRSKADVGKVFPGYQLYMDYEPHDKRFFDGTLHLAKAGSYQPNAWGLYDMHGNVTEWTSTDYVPYPAPGAAKKDSPLPDPARAMTGKVVRGGSWHDRPYRAASGFRIAYPEWQHPYDVGFRIVVEY
jgi:formylglycine-generating enzyme required for sulfatase activity